MQQQFSGPIRMEGGGTVGVRIEHYHADGTPKTVFEILEPYINPHAAYNSKEREDEQASICLETTRERVLNGITSWAQSPTSEPICWLYGPAGAGKSTIATTIAQKFDTGVGGTRLAFSWFFSRRNSNRSDLIKFFPTFARRLAHVLPSFKEPLLKALTDTSIFHSSLAHQYRKLIDEPIRSLEGRISPMLVVIDGLDEYTDKESGSQGSDTFERLIKLLTESLLPFRFLFASRPEHHIHSIFTGLRVIPKPRLIALQDYTTLTEMENYLRSELGQVGTRFDLPQPWPSEAEIKTLAKKAEGIFIYASTVIKFVGDNIYENPRRKFKQVMDAHTGLDSLFTQVLDNAKQYSDFYHVFGVLFFLRGAVGVSHLGGLIQLDPWDVRFALRGCPSILLIPADDDDYIRPYHTSLVDFVTDPARAQAHYLDPTMHHQSILSHCINLVGSYLDGKNNWSTSLKYPYLNWCHHLGYAISKVTNLNCIENPFLEPVERMMANLIQKWMLWIPKLISHKDIDSLKKDVMTMSTILKDGDGMTVQRINLTASVGNMLAFLDKVSLLSTEIN